MSDQSRIAGGARARIGPSDAPFEPQIERARYLSLDLALAVQGARDGDEEHGVMQQPRLIDMVKGMPDKRSFGPRRAVVQCHHGSRRYDVAEVRGHVVIGTTWPHDLKHANYEIFAVCTKCPPPTGLRTLDLNKIRAALREPHVGVLKLNVDNVSHSAG